MRQDPNPKLNEDMLRGQQDPTGAPQPQVQPVPANYGQNPAALGFNVYRMIEIILTVAVYAVFIYTFATSFTRVTSALSAFPVKIAGLGSLLYLVCMLTPCAVTLLALFSLLIAPNGRIQRQPSGLIKSSAIDKVAFIPFISALVVSVTIIVMSFATGKGGSEMSHVMGLVFGSFRIASIAASALYVIGIIVLAVARSQLAKETGVNRRTK